MMHDTLSSIGIGNEKEAVMQLKVHSIESFSTLDGPGIRYVIFLQGCAFRCRYCHNPDTWAKNEGKVIDVADVLWEVNRNIDYLKPNRGGITISGGDPMEQPEAVAELFEEAAPLPITTCLDTAGYRLDDEVKRMLRATDLVLLDMKQPIPERHKELTGQTNETVLAFQDYLDEKGIPYWLRVTCVTGVNDDDETINAVRDRFVGRSACEKVEVLPYHTLGVHKWELLSIPYTLTECEPLSKERAKEIHARITRT